MGHLVYFLSLIVLIVTKKTAYFVWLEDLFSIVIINIFIITILNKTKTLNTDQ